MSGNSYTLCRYKTIKFVCNVMESHNEDCDRCVANDDSHGYIYRITYHSGGFVRNLGIPPMTIFVVHTVLVYEC